MPKARERDVQNRIMLHVGARPFLRLWRQNVGVAVPHTTVRAALNHLEHGRVNDAMELLRRARYIRFGVKGAADLTGALACGKRLELEVKSATGRQRDGQRQFQNVCESLDVLYAVVRSEEEADAVLDKHLETCSVCRRRTTWRTT